MLDMIFFILSLMAYMLQNYSNKTLEAKDVKTLPLKEIRCSIDSSPALV